jgi:hypothetical protein
MSLEVCEASCVGYTYFGTEYGRECTFAVLSRLLYWDLHIKVIAEIPSQMVRSLRSMQNAISLARVTAPNFAGRAEDFPYINSTQLWMARYLHQIQHLTYLIFLPAGFMMDVGLIVQVEHLNINNQTTKTSLSNLVWQFVLHLITTSLVLNTALSASAMTLLKVMEPSQSLLQIATCLVVGTRLRYAVLAIDCPSTPMVQFRLLGKRLSKKEIYLGNRNTRVVLSQFVLKNTFGRILADGST